MSKMEEDSVTLDRMVFHGYHGVYAEEKRLGQRFYVTLTANGNFAAAGTSDALIDAVDYGPIYKIVKGVMEGPSANLLEHLGERICQQTLAQSPQIESVAVSITKPSAPVAGVLDGATVTIRRKRSND